MVVMAALWLSFIYLAQMDIRNTLRGSPGEHSPLRLALHGLPVALAATACFIVAVRASMAGGGRAQLAVSICLAVLLVLALVLAASPAYAQALSEFVTLPWDNWRYSR